ncbi:hypothetical protein CDD83_5461 [Cordyceps sp. RAO-2017]|nr:hypothetical protein CDD83_5461 [Cordyceps sp. RAO-2017]
MNDQNDTLSRQIDMHYRDMQRHAETSRAHTGALTSIVGAHASVGQAAHENLAVAGTLVGHLSQVIINLPQSVNQVVNNAVAQAVQGALAQVMAAQNQSWEQVQAMVHYHYANIEYHRAAAVQQMLHQQQQQGHVHPPAGPQHAGQPPQWQHEGQPQGRHGDAENGRQNVPGTNTLRGKFKAVLAKLRRLGRN